MAADVDIFPTEGNVRGPLIGSVALHTALFALALFGYLIPFGRGESWGGTTGGGGAMSATLVSSIPLASASDGDAERARQRVQRTDAIAAEGNSQARTQGDSHPRARDQAQRPARNAAEKASAEGIAKEEDNKIPFGEGGPVSGPYGAFSAGGAKGGLSFTGGTGDFGSRFGWYVDAVRRKVSDNWLKYEVDPNIDTARRVYITFDITRSGAPTNIQVEQSSGIPSLDLSAERALQRIDTFGPLPQGYSGSYVSVEFWFDYKR